MSLSQIKVNNNVITGIDDYPVANSENLITSKNVYNLLNVLKNNAGSCYLISNIDENTISITKDNGIVSISIPKLLYAYSKSTHTSSDFLHPDASTFEIPQDGNIAVIGIIIDS